MPTCRHCSQAFEITKDDLAFYDKVSPVIAGKKYEIPPPTLCPPCRQQRRLVWRNERKLYHRKSDFGGKQMISFYSPEKPFVTYHPDEWWSDAWDGVEYGRAYDPSKPFFPQFQELFKAVPKLSMMIMHAENADYAPYTIHYKDSYLCVSGYEGESNYYCYYVNQSKDCVDCSVLFNSELCYDCTCCKKIYRCIKCFDCENVSESLLCFDCKNCKDCIGCVGLRGKQYCVLNEELTKEEYEKRKEELTKHLGYAFRNFYPEVLKKKLEIPHLFAILTNSEHCTGHFAYDSKNSIECFDVLELEDCKFCSTMLYSKDCYDSYYFPKSELMYEVMSSNRASQECFCSTSWDSHDLLYCFGCMHCEHCFGCSDLRKKKYCILNTQYTKEEYEALVPVIIDNMRKSGEWGEYFPVEIGPYAYNETVAHEYFPLTKKEVLSRGWTWLDEEERKDQYMGPDYVVPEKIEDVEDDITKQILKCEVTGKPYKIIPQELKFYREMGIPVPKKCPDQRHKERMALRNPRKLWGRKCAKCSAEIQTTYAPNRPEIVYCERCYLETVY